MSILPSSLTSHASRIIFRRIIGGMLLFIIGLLASIYALLWHYNQQINAPLPIITSLSANFNDIEATAQAVTPQHLTVTAEQTLKPALEPIVQRFIRHYPNITLEINYQDLSSLASATDADIDTFGADVVLLPRELPKVVQPYFSSTGQAESLAKNTSTISQDTDPKTTQPHIPVTQAVQQWATLNHYRMDFAQQGHTLYESKIIANEDSSVLFSQFLLTTHSQNDFKQAGLQSIDPYHARVDSLLHASSML
ncbi:hypothetical protein [Psychrobacter sp. I-STPA6b]|uniref:hypothetical protein n=1 Tax=Psychrobacter sp. I-STPA6b TaxID=2585718 RepID=UPI001D0C8330|nr:hypothetical protein [Psychrobacter sp. I-STPA6b]